MLNRAILASALVVALVACGSAAASHKSKSGVLATSHSAGATVITLHKTKLGKVLATSSGMTLYLYTPDAKNKSNCYASCSSVWPPLTTKGKVSAGAGVMAKLLGTTKRTNGQREVTYNGHPLYRFTGDSKAGQVNGEGYAGIWYVLSAAGKAVKHAAGAGTTGSAGGGYTPPGY